LDNLNLQSGSINSFSALYTQIYANVLKIKLIHINAMAVKFLTQPSNPAPPGWIDVIRTRDGQRLPLPHYLKVNYLRTTNNRDYFIPYEHKDHRNTEFSVTRKPDGSSCLVDGQHLPSAVVTFNPRSQLVYYGSGTYESLPISVIHNDQDYPILPDGTYDLEIPDYPQFGDRYLSQTPYARCWFRIRPDGVKNKYTDRYLHPGTITKGCVTGQSEVYAEFRWV
jgi:hypothetical protein